VTASAPPEPADDTQADADAAVDDADDADDAGVEAE
jgi:hypothetical protein